MTGSGRVSIRTEAALISILAAAASTLVITTGAGMPTGCLTTRTVGTTPPETSGCLWILYLRIPRYQALRTMRTAPTLMEDTTGVLAVTGKHRQHHSHMARTARTSHLRLRRPALAIGHSACLEGSNMSTSMWMGSTNTKAPTIPPSAQNAAQKSPDPASLWTSRTLTRFAHAWACAGIGTGGTAKGGLSLLKEERPGSTSSWMTVAPLQGN